MSDPRDDGPVDPNRPPESTPPPVPPAPEGGGYAQPSSVPYGSESSQASGYGQPSYGAPAPTKTLSLIGMIAGIVGLLGSGIAILPIIGSILGLFIPAAAIVLGFLGKSREGAPARPFWLTALITGFIGVGIALVALVVWIIVFSVGSSDGFNYDY